VPKVRDKMRSSPSRYLLCNFDNGNWVVGVLEIPLYVGQRDSHVVSRSKNGRHDGEPSLAIGEEVGLVKVMRRSHHVSCR
jgi:hypothetical protein